MPIDILKQLGIGVQQFFQLYRYKKIKVSPLHIAAENGHLMICKLIIENVKEKNPACNDGETPLYLAVKNNHLNILNVEFQCKKRKNITYLLNFNLFWSFSSK